MLCNSIGLKYIKYTRRQLCKRTTDLACCRQYAGVYLCFRLRRTIKSYARVTREFMLAVEDAPAQLSGLHEYCQVSYFLLYTSSCVDQCDKLELSSHSTTF